MYREDNEPRRFDFARYFSAFLVSKNDEDFLVVFPLTDQSSVSAFTFLHWRRGKHHSTFRSDKWGDRTQGKYHLNLIRLNRK